MHSSSFQLKQLQLVQRQNAAVEKINHQDASIIVVIREKLKFWHRENILKRRTRSKLT